MKPPYKPDPGTREVLEVLVVIGIIVLWLWMSQGQAVPTYY